MSKHKSYLNDALSKHQYSDFALPDILNLLAIYKDLRPSMSDFVFNDGSNRELLSLEGTIPVPYKGKTHHIPVATCLLETYPYNPPMVYVKPTITMAIRPGRHVDPNGKVYLPYLADWRHPSSDLLGLIQILVFTFAEEPPVYSIATYQQLPSSRRPGPAYTVSQGPVAGRANYENYLKNALSKYMFSDKANGEICSAMDHFKHIRPTVLPCVFTDGSWRELLSLDGIIQVPHKGIIYNIPVCLWLLETHPYSPPIVYVKPTNTMQIMPGRCVDAGGKVHLPYLHEWEYPQSNLLRLFQILTSIFIEELPVCIRSSPLQPQTSQTEVGKQMRMGNNSSRRSSEGTEMRTDDTSRRVSEGTQMLVGDAFSRQLSEGTEMRIDDTSRRVSDVQALMSNSKLKLNG